MGDGLDAAIGGESPLALALVNTLVKGTAGVFEWIPDDAALTGWLRAHRLTVDASADRLERLTRLRTDCRELLESVHDGHPLPAQALARLNDAAAGPVRTVLTADRILILVGLGSETADAVIARDLIRLIASTNADRVRICAAEDCDRMFLQDHRRRIWCSPRCGSRIRARRHTARRRAASRS